MLNTEEKGRDSNTGRWAAIVQLFYRSMNYSEGSEPPPHRSMPTLNSSYSIKSDVLLEQIRIIPGLHLLPYVYGASTGRVRQEDNFPGRGINFGADRERLGWGGVLHQQDEGSEHVGDFRKSRSGAGASIVRAGGADSWETPPLSPTRLVAMRSGKTVARCSGISSRLTGGGGAFVNGVIQIARNEQNAEESRSYGRLHQRDIRQPGEGLPTNAPQAAESPPRGPTGGNNRSSPPGLATCSSGSPSLSAEGGSSAPGKAPWKTEQQIQSFPSPRGQAPVRTADTAEGAPTSLQPYTRTSDPSTLPDVRSAMTWNAALTLDGGERTSASDEDQRFWCIAPPTQRRGRLCATFVSENTADDEIPSQVHTGTNGPEVEYFASKRNTGSGSKGRAS